MPVRITEFTPDHYEDIAALHNASRPEEAISGSALEVEDSNRDPSKLLRRTLAWDGDDVVGHAYVQHSRDDPAPGNFVIEVQVRPDRQGRGIGRALYDELQLQLRELDVASVAAGARADHPRADRFLRDRGFERLRRHVFSVLDLTSAAVPRVALPDGVRAASLAELLRENGPEQVHGSLVELIRDFTRDIPGSERAAEDAGPADVARNLAGEDVIPEAYLIAVGPQGYVAKSCLRRRPDALGTGSTGVARAWRRHGLALALKCAAIEWARATGVRSIHTANESTNEAMLAINRRLGFRPTHEYVVYESR